MIEYLHNKMDKREADRTAKLLCKTAKTIDGCVIIEILSVNCEYLNLIVDRNTNEKWLSSILEGRNLSKQSDLSNLMRMTDVQYSIDHYANRSWWRLDRLKLSMLQYLFSLDMKGASFTVLSSVFRNYDRSELIKAIDELMRAGLVMKAATGGLWWVGNWRKFNRTVGYLPWLSPGVYVGIGGRLCVAKKYYGIKERKNYRPAKFYTGD